MNVQQIITLAVLVSAIIGAAVALVSASKWLWQLFRRLSNMLDDMLGEAARNGLPARPGIVEELGIIKALLAGLVPQLEQLERRQAASERRLATIEAQLLPNGGGSLRDAVDRLAPAEDKPVIRTE